MRDPVAAQRNALEAYLQEEGPKEFTVDTRLAADVRWSPHLYDVQKQCAWHCLTETPPSDRWAARMMEAKRAIPDLLLGVCGPIHVLKEEKVLDLIDNLEAFVLISDFDEPPEMHYSACDLVYGAKLRLSHEAAARILDRTLKRAVEEKNYTKKGVLLEVLTAVLLSQVSGFEVYSRNVSNRSQQIDVLVHNRNTSGVLRSGEIVIAEAKNWANPVGTTEYYSVVRKIESRHGRALLGFFVTTDRFTRGVEREMLRDSVRDILVVPLDQESLPKLWRTGKSITENIESAVLKAAVGQ